MEYTILIVDDEDDILEFVGYNLRKEGYKVLTATNGRDALRIARSETPHLVILDVMMPEMDGIETCVELKKIAGLEQTIISFFTARSEDYSLIAGYDAGADDYIAKPIKPKVLTSKIKALLRRIPIDKDKESIITAANLVIDSEKYTVLINGNEITLPRKEFELLSLLASKPNRVFSRDEIFAKIWTGGVIVGDRTIDVHIRKLREKLGIENIKTLKGVGYKFEDKNAHQTKAL